MRRTDTLSLELPTDVRYVPVATFAARNCAQGAGFGAEDVDRICLAMEEAFAHALEFGYGGERETVRVELSRTALGLRLGVRFRGLPLDVEQLPRYDPARAQTHGDATGMSLLLIEKVLDTASFSVESGGIRTVSMEKRLPVQPVDDAEAAPQERPPRSSQPSRLRRALPDDAEAIARLALRSHGSVLFGEHIYYPDRLREMLRAEDMVSVVLETEDTGEVVGHGALLKEEAGTMVEELTYGMVSPEFRARGTATAMADFLERDAVERGVYAIEAFAVTNHVHSQRAVLSTGFSESGLVVDISPASRAWGEGEDGARRIGNLVYTKYLRGLGARRLYVPARHREMVEGIYARHGVDVRMAEGGQDGPAPGTETGLWSMSNFLEGWTTVLVGEYGADAPARVRERMERACAQGIPEVHLLLPLADPATATMADRFEAMGFFFAGVCPVFDGGESLVLQYVDTPRTDYDSIHVHSAFAEEIKRYVMACDPRTAG